MLLVLNKVNGKRVAFNVDHISLVDEIDDNKYSITMTNGKRYVIKGNINDIVEKSRELEKAVVTESVYTK